MPLFEQINPDPYRPPTMAAIEQGRAMYREGFTVSRCLAATGMSLGTFYYWLDGGPRGESGEPMLTALARRRNVVGRRSKPFAANRVSLLARLYRAGERQVVEIEQQLAAACSGPERERDVRMLCQLSDMLRKLSGLDPAGGAPSAEDIDKLAAARARMQRAAVLRAADKNMHALTTLARGARTMHALVQEGERDKAEAAAAAEEAAREAESAAEFRRELARRIENMVAVHRAEREQEAAKETGEGD